MAEEKIEGRELTWQRLLPWTMLFKTFQETLDLNKLVLAGAGILLTAFSWWFLALIFTANEKKTPPTWPGRYVDNADSRIQAWQNFRRDRDHWNLMNESAGLSSTEVYEVADIAETPDEYDLFENLKPGPDLMQRYLEQLQKLGKEKGTGVLGTEEEARYRARAAQYLRLGMPKPYARLSVSPWTEDRGPNPYLLITGQAGIPWEAGGVWEWFTRDQFPVLVEPLVKLIRPIVYFLSSRNDFTSRLYFFLVILTTVLIWSFFGGAITRIAAVHLARGERIGATEALRFVLKRFVSYITAPLIPLGVVVGLMFLLAIYGFLAGITYLIGDVLISGLLWIIPLVFGVIMAMALVGLVGWPLMAATISTEGTDSWEAFTRAYGYVYQKPWHYIWYSVVSVLYGAVVIFFVGFIGSFTIYLAKWGVSHGPLLQTLDREPNFLFIYAPTSFHWRDLLLEGTRVQVSEKQQESDPRLKELNGASVVTSRVSPRPGSGTVGGYSRWSRIDPRALEAYKSTLAPWNRIGAALVGFWLGVAFLLMLAFGYVFFWTASTIMYLLLRKSLESAEFDEVYLEEEDYEASFRMPSAASVPSTPGNTPAPKAASLPMVEPPRATVVPAPAPVAAPASVPATPSPASSAPAQASPPEPIATATPAEVVTPPASLATKEEEKTTPATEPASIDKQEEQPGT